MKNKTIIHISCIFCVLFLTLFGIISSVSEITTSATTVLEDIAVLSNVSITIDGVVEDISLPYTFSDLPDDTAVTLTAYFTIPVGNYVYIENDATAYSIYINGDLLYEFGADGTYPSFLLDPVSTGQLIYTEASNEPIHFTVDFVSPVGEDNFTISPIYFGSYSALLTTLFSTMGVTFILGVFLVFGGIFLFGIALIIMFFNRRNIVFLWLGLSTFAIGVWLLAGCNLTGFFVDYQVSLYLRSLCGMIVFPIPLIYFAICTIKFHNEKILLFTALGEIILGTLGLLLCYLGIIPLSISDILFNITVPICVSIFSAAILWEYIVHHNKMAQRFTLPSISLALFTILEFLNRRFNFAILPISFFQIGILVFLIAMGILAGLYLKDIILLNNEKSALTYQMSLMRHQIDGQKKHNELLMANATEIRKQRHDLRHQLAVIRELTQNENTGETLAYIDTLISNIPTTSMKYCNNISINAILSHYVSIGEAEGITFDIRVITPPASAKLIDTDYCVIFGNLVENAIEACRHIKEGEKFIKLTSRLQYNTLIINMENSFDGYVHIKNGKYHSRKRDSHGIGLSSIHTIARLHGGDVQFKTNENVFTSYIYFII